MVNNFFMHCIKEIDIKQYGDNLQILPPNIKKDQYIDTLLLC